MEKGFVPDFGAIHTSHLPIQALWHPGDAEEKKFLGMKTGGVKVELPEARKIVADRCTDFVLLRSYAE